MKRIWVLFLLVILILLVGRFILNLDPSANTRANPTVVRLTPHTEESAIDRVINTKGYAQANNISKKKSEIILSGKAENNSKKTSPKQP